MQLKAHICSRQACSIPWGNPFAGFDISSRHVEGANTDGILIVHGQEVAAHKHCLHTSTPCLDDGFQACMLSDFIRPMRRLLGTEHVTTIALLTFDV